MFAAFLIIEKVKMKYIFRDYLNLTIKFYVMDVN